MIAWGISRLAGATARSFGADEESANLVSLISSTVLTVFDPIGGTLGTTQAVARMERANGNTTAKYADQALNVAALVLAIDGIPGDTNARA